jgi:hypothetical protein
MSCRSPIFIIGTERSGSNLLRHVLNSHSRIAIPHPPHFMRYFSGIAASYGDLAQERNRRRLARDMLALLAVHIHPWECAIDEDRVTRESSPTLFGVVAAIHEQYLASTGKARWGCKSTFMIRQVAAAVAEYPDAQFLWLVRDPRDVAASSRRSIFSTYHPYLTARLWREDQACGFQAQEALGERRLLLLRYEDLVVRPEPTLRRLAAFLGEDYEPRMLDFHRSDEARKSAALSESWRNTSRPINAASVGAHREHLSAAERAQVEAVAGPLMLRLGYPVDAIAAPAEPSHVRTHVLDLYWRLLAEHRSLRHDRNHWQRWSRDGMVRWLTLKAWLRGVTATASPTRGNA